jgi:probable phosphoglycerate mutase
MILTLVRHGRTAWNDTARMQGRADIPLSASGREGVLHWELPGALVPAQWLSSPLARARQTASVLGACRVLVADELVEMDWGEWEGATLVGLRAAFGVQFESNAARGLDFRPPGGESPREVGERVAAWLARIARHRGPLAAVTHKGVIRAVMAMATGWTMTGKPPVRLADETAQVFAIGPGGAPRALAYNVPLRRAAGGRTHDPGGR